MIAALRRVPLPVWAATMLHVAIMVGFVFLYPAYWAFDESGHISRVISAEHGDLTPIPDAYPYVSGVGNSYQFFSVPDQPPFINYVAPSRAVRPSFDKLGGATPYIVPGALPDQLAQHPPGYYAFAAGVLRAIPNSAHFAWDQTIALLRLLDVLLLAPLPLICWAIARRFARPGIAVAAAFAPALVPGLERLGASVNNDDLLILLTSVFLLALSRVVTGDRSVRTATVVGASIALALLVKGFALVLPPVALLAYLVAARRSRQAPPWKSVAVVAVGCALGGLWWLHNLIVYGVVQPSGLTPAQADQVWPPLPAGVHGHFVPFLQRISDVLNANFWGGLGLPSPPNLPTGMSVTATVLVLGLAILGLSHRQNFAPLGVLVLPVLLILGPSLLHGWHLFQRTGQPAGVQGRYLYPGFVALVAVVACGADRLVDRWSVEAERFAPLVACASAVLLEISAVAVVVAHSWLPPGSSVGRARDVLHSIGDHSPFAGSATIGLLGLVAVAVAAAFVVTAITAFTRRMPVADAPAA
ncbi:MAG: hypothetical protein QOC73_1917 [Actinomycetota bacterium]|nr:hypothetical protein [Actinomycetota bacterium]